MGLGHYEAWLVHCDSTPRYYLACRLRTALFALASYVAQTKDGTAKGWAKERGRVVFVPDGNRRDDGDHGRQPNGHDRFGYLGRCPGLR